MRPIHDFNLSWNFDEYRAQDSDIASQKGMLEKINNWQRDLEKLRNKPIGVLEVDSKRLKGELIPLRDARLAEIKDNIKDIARELCAHLLEHYKDCLVKLASKPSYLKDFAAQAQVVNAMKEEEKSSSGHLPGGPAPQLPRKVQGADPVQESHVAREPARDAAAVPVGDRGQQAVRDGC